jgi:hypothetical protein
MHPAPLVPGTPAIDLTAPWPDPKKPDAEPVSHLAWAEGVARSIAVSKFGFRRYGQETADLVAVAQTVLVKLVARFDASKVKVGSSVDQLFRGFAFRHIPTECRREGERLKNHGWYRTTDDKRLKKFARGGGELAPQTGNSAMDGWGIGPRWNDRDDDEPDEELEPVEAAHRPFVVILRRGQVVSVAGVRVEGDDVAKTKRGAVCPACGRPALVVVRTHRPTRTLTVRYKRCRECSARVTSNERNVCVRVPAAAG